MVLRSDEEQKMREQEAQRKRRLCFLVLAVLPKGQRQGAADLACSDYLCVCASQWLTARSGRRVVRVVMGGVQKGA